MARRVERRRVKIERLGYGGIHLVRPGRRRGAFIWLKEGAGVPPFDGDSAEAENERGPDGKWRFVGFAQ